MAAKKKLATDLVAEVTEVAEDLKAEASRIAALQVKGREVGAFLRRLVAAETKVTEAYLAIFVWFKTGLLPLAESYDQARSTLGDSIRAWFQKQEPMPDVRNEQGDPMPDAAKKERIRNANLRAARVLNALQDRLNRDPDISAQREDEEEEKGNGSTEDSGGRESKVIHLNLRNATAEAKTASVARIVQDIAKADGSPTTMLVTALGLLASAIAHLGSLPAITRGIDDKAHVAALQAQADLLLNLYAEQVKAEQGAERLAAKTAKADAALVKQKRGDSKDVALAG